MTHTANYITGNSFSIRVISSQYSKITDWNIASLIAPFWRLYLPIDAGAVILFNDREYPLEPMVPMIIPPYTDFSGRCPSAFKKIFCHFDLKSNLQFTHGIYKFNLSEALKHNYKIIITNPSSPQSIPLLNTTLLESLSLGINAIIMDYASVNTLNKRTGKIIKMMRKNLTTPLSNKQLSDAIHMAENSMVRDFKQQTSSAPQKYYMRLRLEYACELLVNTNLSIEEISEKCGFWDRNHFTRYFTRLWQCPPAEFRKRNRGKA